MKPGTIQTSIIVALLLCLSSSAQAQPPKTMSLGEVRQTALTNNRTFLSAKQDETLAEADITRTLADALPEVRFDGNYSHSFSIPSFFFTINDETQEFKSGFKHNFRGSLYATQPLWHGNKVYTGYSMSKLYHKYAASRSDQIKAEILYQADVLFYNISLRRSVLDVLQKEHQATIQNYDVVSKLRSQGMASEFELLQAAVQRDILLPSIVTAESELALAMKRLNSWLGLGLDEDISYTEEPMDTSLAGLPSLDDLSQAATANRPEIIQAQYLTDISKKAIKIARGDYFPKLEAVAAYDWSSASDDFNLRDNISKSWTAGLRVSFPLFEGFRTRGDVSQRTAEHQQARLALNQTSDNIKMEVRQAYDRLMQAKKTLDLQGATIAQAEEGLRISNLRYESGVGTQLEILSAQAALSKARGAHAQALFMFRQARAELKKATTIDIELDTNS